MPDREQSAQWEEHRRRIQECLSPEGHLEGILADRIALNLWRLRRVPRYETEAIVFAQATAEMDVARQRADSGFGKTPSPSEIEAAEEGIESYFHLISSLEELAEMADHVLVPGSDATAIVEAVSQLLSNLREAPETEDGGPESVQAEALSDCTAEELRLDLGVRAVGLGIRVEEILTAALEVAQAQVAELTERLTHMRGTRVDTVVEVERLRRERLLPAEDVMEKVMRYEAHLSRELYKSIHELEVLQARRRGQQTPLVRLDVSGLPTG
jgi:hypothetical protein